MNSDKRTLRKEVREAPAKLAEERVLNLIRHTPRSAAARRVERILELLVTAEAHRETIRREGMKGPLGLKNVIRLPDSQVSHSPRRGFTCGLPAGRFVDMAVQKLNDQYRKIVRQLQSLLTKYEWRPTVVDRFYFSLGQDVLWDGSRSADSGENSAVRYLLFQLDPLNGIPQIRRFRKCKECNDWFYALTKHQSFCREPCRKRYASHSPEFKKKRADYMREKYRPAEKERQSHSLRSAKRELATPRRQG